MAAITYIIPLHKFNADVEKLFSRAVASIDKSELRDYALIVVGPKDVLTKAKKVVKNFVVDDQVKYVENEDTDVYKQINTGVLHCTSSYFCVVQYDDEVTPYWARVAKKYGENEATVLLPIVEQYSAEVPVGLGNELAWDVSFADENRLGYLDAEQLDTYLDFIVYGALIKTEDFISIGGLKPSLKIAAWYEFLLRCLHKNKAIYVVPKIGYHHYVDTPESYSSICKNEISQEEGKWLISIAKEEYFFKEDRNKKFGE